MTKYRIMRATVVHDNRNIATYNEDVVIDKSELEAYKERVKARYGKDADALEVDLVYKEVEG